jgi:pyridoxamine 5'-phosphate oxidase
MIKKFVVGDIIYPNLASSAFPTQPVPARTELMLQTLWSPSLVLAIYINRRAPAARFVQMATVRPDGRPANRTLVFRGFLNDTAQLTFVTDLRSSKLADLTSSAWVELCWYFPVTHEQFRIGGQLTMVGPDSPDSALSTARLECWKELPEPTRLSFTWPPPGEPRDSSVPFPTEHPDPETPLRHFGLLVLDPETVDFLEINGHPQNRWQYERDVTGRWSGREVNP